MRYDEPMLKMTVSIPRELHRRVRIRAAEEGRDMRDVVVEGLVAWLNGTVDEGDPQFMPWLKAKKRAAPKKKGGRSK